MRWNWIDKIVEHEASRRLVAVKAVSRSEEHLDQHVTAADGTPLPVMPASLMIEGMAQTAGILVGSARGFREKVILAKVVVAEIDEDVFPGSTIRYDATLDRIDEAGASTSGVVELSTPPDDGWRRIGRVDLMFSHLDQSGTTLDLPEENFVFSDNFRQLLREAGLEHTVAADA